MNTLSLKAAITRLGDITGKNEAEIKDFLAKDAKNFSGEEIEEIYKAVTDPEFVKEPKKSKESKKSKEPVEKANLNDGLGLEDVDYENFMPNVTRNEDDEEVIKATPDFLKYREIEKKLLFNKHYAFDCVRAHGQFRKKANGDNVLVGIHIISETPKFTSITEWRHIKDLNEQIHNADTPPSNSIYYLLKK
jgi:hypothetical protein